MFLQEFIVSLSHKSNFEFILIVVFFIALIYSVNYWFGLKGTGKSVDEVSKEVSKDPSIATQVKEHLWRKSYDEAYTLNIFKGKVKFTSTWSEQEKFDK